VACIGLDRLWADAQTSVVKGDSKFVAQVMAISKAVTGMVAETLLPNHWVYYFD